MNFKPWMKKMLVSGVAVSMLAGGSASAFANGADKRDHRGDSKSEYKDSGKVEFKGNINIILNFPDLKGGDVEWAAKYIASLASKRVFEGYEDGTFQPRKPISRIEAITAAVRLMGLRDQAESAAEMNTTLNFKDADKIKRDYSWATGYVAVALENDLFLESDESVQPEKPADRLWATTLLVKAMKLSAEAKANMNVTLPYKDANKIPAGSVGYVEVARSKGLIQGYEDNTFRPSQPVTRAELAALLDRTGEQLPGSSQDQTLIRGKLTAAAAGNVLLVQKDDKTTVPVTVDANAYIYRGGVKVTLADLKAGDVLKIRTYNNVAIFVEVTQSAPATEQNTFTVFGLYKGITLGADGKIATVTISQNVNTTVQDAVYNVAPNVSITGGALPADNRVLELKGTGTTVTSIKIL
ncbi:S-layer homology domain-containing protein [Gorillibacterium sp. sgz5001074]|uniref:S-layer homology domain-containing protein n=1 Tax=Gorillibacterium sp. sgz5001074 TaxID=3446695 RepID=UPI003F66D021